MSLPLTEEQRKKIEENRQKALARRAEKSVEQPQSTASGPSAAGPSQSKQGSLLNLLTEPSKPAGHAAIFKQQNLNNSFPSPLEVSNQQLLGYKSSDGHPQATQDTAASSSGPFPTGPELEATAVRPSTSGQSISDTFYALGGKTPRTEGRPPKALQNSPQKASCLRGTCVRTGDRFRVKIGYNQDLIAVFKSLPSRRYGKEAFAFFLVLDSLLTVPHKY